MLNNDSIDPAQTQRFSYDDAERLVGGTGPWGVLSWTYDTVGNRLSKCVQLYWSGIHAVKCVRRRKKIKYVQAKKCKKKP
ncbi:hypothetical protein [Methylobacterium nonmethylotrophicum]|uniref:Uncharacterized protein n=1 Tax=Methylobacterium nonmethylotrophicum TaxID=1141884 RepID=A0A4Z0NUP4_9HYPH|nr:hypothetical protein [Methylobacterium nonmethylotrophicum]TGE01031.1 hypothetical protein EU555_05335 [Methylobacterium nonmethylotrophicum]